MVATARLWRLGSCRVFSALPRSPWSLGIEKKPENSFQLLSDASKLVAFSIVVGGLSFCDDALVGSGFHLRIHSWVDAATKAGGPFGVYLTLIICPGITAVALASFVRLFALGAQDN